ncbi:MAG: hypothetical protein Tp118DCM00d2C30442581_21 [Prokaryotic dsDNA virus sp.]|nr:MAG: hypothetical protein Tp118DCM00d2C30442581_21 [Prokaryotic dsDNA virus sp.]|tara:strand:- start:15232 stop:15888 length:657 start_codon:yes stop_codon:yes gene_type:complete
MELDNPVEIIFTWKGGEDGKGLWKTYDRATKTADTYKKQFTCVVLEQFNGVAGFLQPQGSGQAQSNQVKNLAKEELTVSVWKDGESSVLMSGLYADIKDNLKAKGVKFQKIVYALITSGKYQGMLARFDLQGSASGSWISSKIKDGEAISFDEDGEFKQVGHIKFYAPKIYLVDIKDDDKELGKRMLDELAEFRNQFDKQSDTSTETKDKEELEEIPF